MEQALAAAHARFAADGYARVTMDGVAAEVGVTKPLLYAYWGNKERIYLACLERDADRLVETVAAAVGSAPTPAEATEVGLRAFFDFVSGQSRRARALRRDPARRWRDRPAGDRAPRPAHLAGGRDPAPGVPAGQAAQAARTEVEALSHAVMGAAEALARWWLRTGEIPASEAAELLIATVVPGLRPRSSSTDTGDNR